MSDQWMIAVPDNLAMRRARELRGLSERQAASIIGVTIARYRAYESGRWNIGNAPVEVQARITTFLDPQGWESVSGAKDYII